MRYQLARALRVAVVLSVTSPSVFSGEVQFFQVGDLAGGEEGCVANAVSADGATVVGYSEGQYGEEAFRWRDGAMIGLGDLPGGAFRSEALGVSADGRIVVGVATAAAQVPVVWRDGVLSALPLPDGVFTGQANAVSHDGLTIVGKGTTATSVVGLRWINDVLAPFPSVPDAPTLVLACLSGDGAIVAGWADSTVEVEAVRWDGVWTPLAPFGEPNRSYGRAISADGIVVVGSSSSIAVRWDGSGVHELGAGSDARAVSGDGSVVVGVGPPFIWTSADGWHSLPDWLYWEFGLDARQWSLTPRGISADGLTIVGSGIGPSGELEGWIARTASRCSRTDVSFDSGTDLIDLAILLTHYGQCAADEGFFPPADIDRRGCVDLPDLAMLLAEFGTACDER